MELFDCKYQEYTHVSLGRDNIETIKQKNSIFRPVSKSKYMLIGDGFSYSNLKDDIYSQECSMYFMPINTIDKTCLFMTNNETLRKILCENDYMVVEADDRASGIYVASKDEFNCTSCKYNIYIYKDTIITTRFSLGCYSLDDVIRTLYSPSEVKKLYNIISKEDMRVIKGADHMFSGAVFFTDSKYNAVNLLVNGYRNICLDKDIIVDIFKSKDILTFDVFKKIYEMLCSKDKDTVYHGLKVFFEYNVFDYTSMALFFGKDSDIKIYEKGGFDVSSKMYYLYKTLISNAMSILETHTMGSEEKKIVEFLLEKETYRYIRETISCGLDWDGSSSIYCPKVTI